MAETKKDLFDYTEDSIKSLDWKELTHWIDQGDSWVWSLHVYFQISWRAGNSVEEKDW